MEIEFCRFVFVEAVNRVAALHFFDDRFKGVIPTNRFGANQLPVFALYREDAFPAEPCCDKCAKTNTEFIIQDEDCFCRECYET